MTPPNPFEPPDAPIAPPTPRAGGRPPWWAPIRWLAVAGLGPAVLFNLAAATLAAIVWVVHLQAG